MPTAGRPADPQANPSPDLSTSENAVASAQEVPPVATTVPGTHHFTAPSASHEIGSDAAESVSPPVAHPPAAPPPKPHWAKRLVSDKFALVSSTFVSLGLRVGTTVVMGRLLTPDDYGLYSLVILAPFVFTSLGDLNLPAAMVQIRSHDDETVIDTGTLLTWLLGAAQFAAFLIGGFYLYYFSERNAGDIRVLVLALIMGLAGAVSLFSISQGSVISRARRFGIETRQNLIFSVSSALTGIVLALSGLGVYALALQGLVARLISCFTLARHVPLRLPRKITWGAMRSYAKFCSGITIADYIGNFESKTFELSVLKAGGPVGQARLGEWGRSLTLLSLFSQNFNVAIDRVIYPALCAAQDNRARMHELTRRHLETLMMANLFLASWLYFNAADIIRVVLGPNWYSITPMVQMLAFAIPLQALTSAGHIFCLATGQTFQMTIRNLIRGIIIIPVLFILMSARNDSITIILALLLVAKAIEGFTQIGMCWRLIGWPPRDTFIRIGAMLLIAALLSLAFHEMRHWIPHFLPRLTGNGIMAAFVRVLWFSLLGAALYFVLLRLLARESLRYVTAMARGKR